MHQRSSPRFAMLEPLEDRAANQRRDGELRDRYRCKFNGRTRYRRAAPRPELARRGHRRAAPRPRRSVGVGGFIHVIHGLRHSRQYSQKTIRCISRSLIFGRRAGTRTVLGSLCSIRGALLYKMLTTSVNKDLTVPLAICCFNSFVFNLTGNFILLYYIKWKKVITINCVM